MQAEPEHLERFLNQNILEAPRGIGSSFCHPLWIRNGFLESDNPLPSRFVFHGHTPGDFTGKHRQGRLNLDAGSYNTGLVASALVTTDGVITMQVWGEN